MNRLEFRKEKSKNNQLLVKQKLDYQTLAFRDEEFLNGVGWENRFNEIDWDFTNATTQYLTHKYHSYPARFIPQIPRTTIRLFTSNNKREIILDPFCGCGTTCVEARLAHKNTIGIDANPLAVLISKVKSKPIHPTILKRATQLLLDYLRRKSKLLIKTSSLVKFTDSNNFPEFPDHLLGLDKGKPEYVRYQKIYLDYVKHGITNVKINSNFFKLLTLIFNSIKEHKFNDNFEPKIVKMLENYFYIAFSSLLNTLAKNHTKINDISYPLILFENQLNFMQNEMIEFYNLINVYNFSKIFRGNSWDISNLVDDEEIDHIVTSPPYANALDYHREHKLNILWLGLPFNSFRYEEIGAHSIHMFNRFRMLSEYLSDMFRSIAEMCRVLKPGKYCCIVIGDSTVEHIIAESHNYFKIFGEFVGFSFLKEVLRNIDISRKYIPEGIGNINQEYILVFKKVRFNPPKDSDVISLVESTLLKIKKSLQSNKDVFDKNTLLKSFNKKRKFSTINELKEYIIKKNIEKIDEAINKLEKDCFRHK
jgi:DNA modification methylase